MIQHIRKDAVGNDDGFALVTSGLQSINAMVMRTMEIEPIINFLMASGSWERFWLHSRYATTSTVNLSTTHAFEVDSYFVMHNGVLSHSKAKGRDVDSRLIPDLIRAGGVDVATKFLLDNEKYANVFIIQPESGEWKVLRLERGTLYTDAYGNYATNTLLDIYKPVENNSITNHDEQVVQLPTSWQSIVNKYAPPATTPYKPYKAKTGTGMGWGGYPIEDED